MYPHQARKPLRAMRQCFTIPEIFEGILLNLNIRDLLFAQLVHTHFKIFIEQSIKLQQRLFLAPDPTRTTPELHPLLKCRFPALLSLRIPDSVRSFHDFNQIMVNMEWYTDEIYRERMLRKNASWRRMFPVQPPAKLELIKIFSHDYCINRRGRCVPAQLRNQYQRLQETGIKMGLLYDLVVHFNSANPDPRIYIHWQMFPTEKEGPEYYGILKVDDGFEELYQFEPEKEKIKNSITFYYQHDSFCGGQDTEPEPPLKINSPFVSMVEEDCTTLLKFLKIPDIENTSWGAYMIPEHRDWIANRSRRRWR